MTVEHLSRHRQASYLAATTRIPNQARPGFPGSSSCLLTPARSPRRTPRPPRRQCRGCLATSAGGPAPHSHPKRLPLPHIPSHSPHKQTRSHHLQDLSPMRRGASFLAQPRPSPITHAAPAHPDTHRRWRTFASPFDRRRASRPGGRSRAARCAHTNRAHRSPRARLSH